MAPTAPLTQKTNEKAVSMTKLEIHHASSADPPDPSEHAFEIPRHDLEAQPVEPDSSPFSIKERQNE